MLHHMLGIVTTLLFVLMTGVLFVPLMVLAVCKWLIPLPSWRAWCNRGLERIASLWVDINTRHQAVLLPTLLDVDGLDGLSRREWYMMVVNHQSWVDILVLLRVFNHRIPYLKFFLKQSLIWVPLLGLAWWALDFPFMRRYTKEQIARNPSLKGKDIEQTRQSCRRFRHNPATIINFLEGTRFTPEKHAQQGSTYRHLLMPKAGGLAFTLAAMDGQLHRLLDVTIYYPQGRPSYWTYVCGKVANVRVHIRQLPIPPEYLGNYAEDADFRAAFQVWVNELWHYKDDQLEQMRIQQK